MNKEFRKEKLKRFMADDDMVLAVKEILTEKVLENSKDRDVSILASRFLAIEIINQSWKELENYKISNQDDQKERSNLGL